MKEINSKEVDMILVEEILKLARDEKYKELLDQAITNAAKRIREMRSENGADIS